MFSSSLKCDTIVTYEIVVQDDNSPGLTRDAVNSCSIKCQLYNQANFRTYELTFYDVKDILVVYLACDKMSLHRRPIFNKTSTIICLQILINN